DAPAVRKFESPRRVSAAREEVRDVWGGRRAAVARELTKLHEEVVRGSISEVLALLKDPKGEIVVVVEGRRDRPALDLGAMAEEARALITGGMRTREAAAAVAHRHGASASQIYRAIVTSR